MTKTAKGLRVFAVAVLLCAFAGHTGAFCVHNGSDRTMYARQASGGKWKKSFSAELEKGKKGCCNWSTTDCNASGLAPSLVSFDVVYYVSGEVSVCKDFIIPADGDLTICGNNDKHDYRCVPNANSCPK